jgi:large subunit ribosomal protein L25
MAKTHEIKVEKRNVEGKGASRRLRRAGSVPAIVYGGELAPVSIQLAHNDVWHASQNEWFYSSILDLSLGGDAQKVLLRDMQRHPFKQLVLHLDFQRVNENEVIRVRVPLHFMNQELSPAGKTSGVVIMHELSEVEISCLPKNLPEYIEVDLSELQIAEIIHLSGLQLPTGVEIPELRFGKEHDHAVVVAKEVREEAAPVVAEGDAAAAAAGAATAPAPAPAPAAAAAAAAAPAKGAPPAKGAAPAKKDEKK